MSAAAFLLVAFCLVPAAAQSPSEPGTPGIKVGLDSAKPFWLRVTVRSGATSAATFSKSQLPWGSTHSMIFVAVRPNGSPIDMELPIGDSTGGVISLAPGTSLTGDIDLHWYISDLNRVTKESDVLLFWAYKSPKELHIRHWSGGVILFPKRK